MTFSILTAPGTAHSLTSRRPQPTRQEQERSFRPDVEGLRAVAVLMVLLDHAGVALLSGGYVGVDVFFVLSGFLITGLLVREVETTGGISLLNFYARRFRRLLPAGTLVLVATVIGSYLYLGESRANRIAEDAKWSALFASNFRFIQQRTNYLNEQMPPSPLQHYWSLAVEEQFYLVWPALIVLVAVTLPRVPIRLKLGVTLAVIIVGSLIWSIWQTELDATTAYFSPFTRASELGLGALLAVCVPWIKRSPRQIGHALSLVGIVGIVLTVFLFSSTTPFPGYSMLLPVLATVAAVAGGTIAPGGGAEPILRREPFQLVGKLSYSLYLWHWPVLMIAPGYFGREMTVPENLLLCILALGLSGATYVLLENTVRDSATLKSRAPAVSMAVGAALIVISVGLSGWMINMHPIPGESTTTAVEVSNFPNNVQVLRAVSHGANVEDWPDQPPRLENEAYSDECDVTRADTSSSLCVHGDPTAARKLVIFGDSHAAMWIPTLDLIGKQEGWQVIQLTKPGCQAPDFPRYSDTLDREYTECAEYREWALGQLAEIKPDLVIMSSSYKDVARALEGKKTPDGTSEAWEAGLASVIQRVTPLTNRIIVLGDMPYAAEPGIDCLTAHSSEVPECNTPREEAVDSEHQAMERQVAEQNGADYIDVIPWFCTDDICPAVIGGLTTQRDGFHVAENYAVWLSEVLGTAIGLLPERTINSSS